MDHGDHPRRLERLRVAQAADQSYIGPRPNRWGPISLEDTWLGLNEVQAVFITAGVAALIAFWGVFSQRAITARQTTIQYLRASEQDHEMVAARRRFQELARQPAGLGVWGAEDQSQTDEAIAVRTVLNDYELIAIGIERGTMDDVTYRRWFKSAVVNDWRKAAPYVMAVRNRANNDAIYHEFEEMARRYRDGKGMPRRRIFWAKFF